MQDKQVEKLLLGAKRWPPRLSDDMVPRNGFPDDKSVKSGECVKCKTKNGEREKIN